MASWTVPMAELRGAITVAVVLLTLTACTRSGPAERQPTERATTMSTSIVRTDREPIVKRFPRLGDLVAVHWQGSAAGSDTGGAPGPTDVHIQAIVSLRPGDVAAALSRYEWSPAPAAWDASLSAELRRYAPTDGTWQLNEQFAKDVRTSRYSGAVYLDTTGGTVFLDVIGG
jgi:predicted small lipoprotein YifL